MNASLPSRKRICHSSFSENGTCSTSSSYIYASFHSFGFPTYYVPINSTGSYPLVLGPLCTLRRHIRQIVDSNETRDGMCTFLVRIFFIGAYVFRSTAFTQQYFSTTNDNLNDELVDRWLFETCLLVENDPKLSPIAYHVRCSTTSTNNQKKKKRRVLSIPPHPLAFLCICGETKFYVIISIIS